MAAFVSATITMTVTQNETPMDADDHSLSKQQRNLAAG